MKLGHQQLYQDVFSKFSRKNIESYQKLDCRIMKNEVQHQKSEKSIDPIVKYYSRVPNKILSTFILLKDFFQNFLLKFPCTFVYFWTFFPAVCLFRRNYLFRTLGVFFCDSLDLCCDPCHVIKHEL